MSHPVLPGAEPLSHEGTGPHGTLVVHGDTGNPSSMRELAEAFVAAGFHVEMPRLPGRGTHVDDMIPTRWPDYLAEHYGGPVERVVPERSYHVATQDFDKQLIFDTSVAFAEKVAAG
ncbi:MAG: hypothetical protein QM733_08600 [Ilumatobacteraceae bacterium]